MIVFAHLLNDYSGSPRVLRAAIAALVQPGDGSRLFVGSDGSGCLDESGVEITRYWYRRSSHRLVTFFTYLFSQLCLLVRLFGDRRISPGAAVYVNTLLPFGAALYGRLTGRRVVYHLHEVSVSPAPLRWCLTAIARFAASDLIYVSDFHRQCLPIPGVRASTLHNVLDRTFLYRAAASQYAHRRHGCFNVLMLASLREYKGVPEFVELARRLADHPSLRLVLVANESAAAVRRYFDSSGLPSNLAVYSRAEDPVAFYESSCLVVNLSRPDLCKETFGLTLLEAMAFGIPVIAPPVGGPLELVCEGREGFLIDCRNREALAERILGLADDEALCRRLSTAAREKAARFDPEGYADALRRTVYRGNVTS